MRKWAATQVRLAIVRQTLDLTRHALLVVLLAAGVVALILGMLSGDVQVTALWPRV